MHPQIQPNCPRRRGHIIALFRVHSGGKNAHVVVSENMPKMKRKEKDAVVFDLPVSSFVESGNQNPTYALHIAYLMVSLAGRARVHLTCQILVSHDNRETYILSAAHLVIIPLSSIN